MKQQKEARYREWAERRAQRQAEYEAQRKAFEEEEAKRDPWEEEKALCEQLIAFVAKYLPRKEEVRRARGVWGGRPSELAAQLLPRRRALRWRGRASSCPTVPGQSCEVRSTTTTRSPAF